MQVIYLSFIYLRIEYEDNKWVIYDGDGVKASTNGTWLFAEDHLELEDNTIFKAAQTLFKVSIIP